MNRLNALGRHVALAGFMGSGKTSVGEVVAARLGRPFVDLDGEIEARAGSAIADLFATRGESGFRSLEEEVAREVLRGGEPVVVALGGGAVLSERTRTDLASRAFTVLLDVDPETAWQRVAGSGRPLAKVEDEFHALHRDRQPLYEDVADAHARDVDGVLLASAGVCVELGAIDELGELVPGDGPVELVADTHVSGIHGIRAQVALGARDVDQHEVPAGEAAKTPAVLERLWSALRIGRDGSLVALGGGSTTDVVGLAAATYMRASPGRPFRRRSWARWTPGSAARRRSTCRAQRTSSVRSTGPPGSSATRRFSARSPTGNAGTGWPRSSRRASSRAGRSGSSEDRELVRACAAFKSAVCVQDPHDRGPRTQLNLGHTFAHALEAAAGYSLPHGRAVALGLLAALRLSGLAEEVQIVQDVLASGACASRPGARLGRHRPRQEGGAGGRRGSSCWTSPGVHAGESRCPSRTSAGRWTSSSRDGPLPLWGGPLRARPADPRRRRLPLLALQAERDARGRVRGRGARCAQADARMRRSAGTWT